eukprot:scaffold2144_cov215-Pinguiococcus_pyrenoidosus.AAC.6
MPLKHARIAIRKNLIAHPEEPFHFPPYSNFIFLYVESSVRSGIAYIPKKMESRFALRRPNEILCARLVRQFAGVEARRVDAEVFNGLDRLRTIRSLKSRAPLDHGKSPH